MENLILYSYQTLRYYSSSLSNLSLIVVINATNIKYNAKNDLLFWQIYDEAYISLILTT